MSQENKKALSPAIKAVLKKFKMKGTISVKHHSSLVVNIKSGPIDFEMNGRGYTTMSYAHNAKTEEEKTFVTELLAAMNGAGELQNFDESDIMTDYFNIGWYTNINIGKYDKPYEVSA